MGRLMDLIEEDRDLIVVDRLMAPMEEDRWTDIIELRVLRTKT